MKIITIVGARPQFIKASSVSRAIEHCRSLGAAISETLVHTGQHFDASMSQIFFDEMQISEPAYNLGIGGTSHGSMTGRMIEAIERVLLRERPDYVVVYGDTNSTLAGALAAAKLQIEVAHIEAGLRSFNNAMPEEINRILTDRISRFLFCPTQVAVRNLQEEGIDRWSGGPQVVLSGDVMLDSALHYRQLAKRPLGIKFDESFNLCTLHRAENTDNPERLGSILSALDEIASHRQVVLPLHPRTRKNLQLAGFDYTNITLIEPVGYLEMIWLIDQSNLVLTDSGGLQKEAFFFSRPCLTLRDETEWVELVEHGYNRLVGANRQSILDAYSDASFNLDYSLNLYGDGSASNAIVDALLQAFSSRQQP